MRIHCKADFYFPVFRSAFAHYTRESDEDRSAWPEIPRIPSGPDSGDRYRTRDLPHWQFDPDDIADVFRSQFTDEPYKLIEFPCAEEQPCGGHQDYVEDENGNIIGYSAVPTYSSHFHVMISQAILDIAEAEEGHEVYVQWGDFGKRIKKLRAKVAKYPYIHGVMDNRDYDLDTVPHGNWEENGIFPKQKSSLSVNADSEDFLKISPVIRNRHILMFRCDKCDFLWVWNAFCVFASQNYN